MRHAIATAILLLCTSAASADISLGGIAFDDDAFADDLASVSGGWAILGSAASLEDALVGSDATNGAFPNGTDGSDYVLMLFSDNVAVNGPGVDIALFEYGSIENDANVAVTFNGQTVSVHSTDSGDDVTIPGIGTFALNVALLDLDDFGVPADGTVSALQIYPQVTDGFVFTLNAVGAIHSIPEPATVGLFVAGGVLGLRLRRPR